jgi:hypothetical protein
VNESRTEGKGIRPMRGWQTSTVLQSALQARQGHSRGQNKLTKWLIVLHGGAKCCLSAPQDAPALVVEQSSIK